MTITKKLVEDINRALDKGLVKGKGVPVEGKMCVEALICFKLGLPHSDNPPCVGSEVRRAKLALNDCDWSSNKARAEGMRKLAIAQLGSDQIDQEEFKIRLRLKSTKIILPFLIQKHYDSSKVKDKQLLNFKLKFKTLEKLDDNLWQEFYNYYYYNYYYYYYDYDYNYYNYNYYNYNYYNYYYGDKFLLLVADTILQTLIELKSKGCKYI